MAQLFNITHDANNLNDYDSTVTDEGDLSTGTPGLASTTAKMEALIDDDTDIYGEVTIGSGMNDLRCRFYIDPNALTMDTDENFVVVKFTGNENNYLAEIVLRENGANYKLRWIGQDDGGTFKTGTRTAITDAEHYVEFHLVRATNAGSNDGTVDWWIDGVHVEQLTGIDNFDQMSNVPLARLGAVRSIDAGTSGTLHLDEFKANDDGSQIGPLVPPTLEGFAYVF